MSLPTTKTTQTSVAAVVSLVFGIMSPIVLITLVPAVVTSLLAVLLGHSALLKIGRSDGGLLGRSQAIAGLVLGYIFLPISLFMSPGFFRYPEPTKLPPTMQLWREAERSIANSSGLSLQGNSPEAVKLAGEVSTNMTRLGALAFVKSKGPGTESAVHESFNVHCHLTQGNVCFLIHIPDYHRYQPDAKKALSTLAWQSGKAAVAQSERSEGLNMAIGLKGRFLYGDVMIGPADRDAPLESNLTSLRLEQFYQ